MAKIKYDVDVLIIGAGPSGLMLACQLLMHNITFRIIDKKASPAIHSGALILHARTLEILDEMGLADKAIEAGIIAKFACIRFNSPQITSIDLSNMGVGLTRFPFFLMLEQWRTENILIEFIRTGACDLENNTELLSFTNEDEFVTSEIRTPSGEIKVIKSKFLIGADGSNSLVRNLLGIPFPGKTHKQRLFITDCEAQLPLPEKEFFFTFKNDYILGCFPIDSNRWRIDGLIPALQQKDLLSFEDVRDFFAVDKNRSIEFQKPQWFSVFRSHSRCAKVFREKRCFLVGDAAHIHSPVGAQGMNSGMQDSYNLAWKLALFIRGKATDDFLDSYDKERRPIALKNIWYTDLAYSLITSGSLFAKFLRLYLFPFVLPFVKSLLERKTSIQTYFFKAVSGIGTNKKGISKYLRSGNVILNNSFQKNMK